MKKILLIILVILLLFVLFLLYNTSQFTSTQIQAPAAEKITVPETAKYHFAEAISIRTTSFENESDFDSTQFKLFNTFLEKTYPNIYEKCEHKIFNEFSHLFTWKGSDESLEPIVLMAHIDAVPIASPAMWTFHPYTTGITNDTIYGRGTMDDKCSLLGIMEAAELLAKENYQPQRTIYLAFGHDEEVLGTRGAVPIAEYIKSKGKEAYFVLDEGLARVEDLIPGIDEPVAMIGISEKGYATVELTVIMKGGHSSTPEKETSIDVLSKAISALKQNPMPAKLTPVMEGFLNKIGPEMDFKTRLALSNMFLFKSQVMNNYASTASGNALVRTTTSPTIFEAGIKENVIPTKSTAVVNFRILPGDDKEAIRKHLIKVINDERVQIEFAENYSDPSPISPIEHEAYITLEKTIKASYPEAFVAPSLVVGATDSRHFTDVSPNVYRFAPFKINSTNLNCFHGVDERVSVDEFEDAIRFYKLLILNANKK